MEIIGLKNLQLVKRALMSHLTYCAQQSVRSDDKTTIEKWDPEIAEVNRLLDSVDINIRREHEYADVDPVFAGE